MKFNQSFTGALETGGLYVILQCKYKVPGRVENFQAQKELLGKVVRVDEMNLARGEENSRQGFGGNKLTPNAGCGLRLLTVMQEGLALCINPSDFLKTSEEQEI